jgi:hypothetical protein
MSGKHSKHSKNGRQKSVKQDQADKQHRQDKQPGLRTDEGPQDNNGGAAVVPPKIGPELRRKTIRKQITMALARAGAILTLRKLRNNTNAYRTGIADWNVALNSLLADGTIIPEVCTGKPGDPKGYCIMEYGEDELNA